ncbi:hypothetical protein DYZ94_19275 [Klebsiella variicola]|nr:hypothetical protein BC497_02640 [Klebsiella variicola]PLK32824.1 hypothetical protein CYD38_20460 [Klebsiella variicola]PXK99383.1 hypothetical protein DMS11_06420 [Klebsiella variicola]PXL25066.1 hypothetical protein DMS66_01425 [Klebsiella variicola]PXL49056.1 hypothetical protein DMS47_06810 [Klebsiella variicola]
MSTECTFIVLYIIFCAIDGIFAFFLACLKPVSSSLFQKSKYPRARHSNFSVIHPNLVSGNSIIC